MKEKTGNFSITWAEWQSSTDESAGTQCVCPESTHFHSTSCSPVYISFSISYLPDWSTPSVFWSSKLLLPQPHRLPMSRSPFFFRLKNWDNCDINCFLLALHSPEICTVWRCEKIFQNTAAVGRCCPSGQLSKSRFLQRLPRLSLQWWLLLHCCLTCLPADETGEHSLALVWDLSSASLAPAGAACPRALLPPGTSGVCCWGAAFFVSVNISWGILCFPQESRVYSQRGLPAGSGTTASGALLSPGWRRKVSPWWCLVTTLQSTNPNANCEMRGTAEVLSFLPLWGAPGKFLVGWRLICQVNLKSPPSSLWLRKVFPSPWLCCDPNVCVKWLSCLQPDEARRRKAQGLWKWGPCSFARALCLDIWFVLLKLFIWQPALNPQQWVSRCLHYPHSAADGGQTPGPCRGAGCVLALTSRTFGLRVQLDQEVEGQKSSSWLLMRDASSSVPFRNVRQVLLHCRQVPALFYFSSSKIAPGFLVKY